MDAILNSLRAALEATPGDAVLRMHYATLLSDSGERDEAVRQAAIVLQGDPVNATALAMITGSRAAPAPDAAQPPRPRADDGLAALDAELSELIPPLFVQNAVDAAGDDAFEVESTTLRLADVGGMVEVKRRLDAAFLAPMRNPELAKVYGKSMRGGLLMYGPPGCGKTFLARAVAGELGARFLSVSLADVLDMYIGQSERNIHELFEIARANAPCLVFLDEIDALGQKRTRMQGVGRGAVNQLLTEMDGLGSTNDGVFVLGATNHPWDVDVALRRPGRFDRMLLVLPPDEEARAAILRYHLSQRPVANIDLARLAKMTDGLSGADLAYACELASEAALLDSAASGVVRLIQQADVEVAIKDVRPSIGSWLETARNVAQFANEGGAYDELLLYLRQKKLV